MFFLYCFVEKSEKYIFKLSVYLGVQGTLKLVRLAKSLAANVNVKRKAKGLLPRPVSISEFLFSYVPLLF